MVDTSNQEGREYKDMEEVGEKIIYSVPAYNLLQENEEDEEEMQEESNGIA